jgi:hypothetical protein
VGLHQCIRLGKFFTPVERIVCALIQRTDEKNLCRYGNIGDRKRDLAANPLCNDGYVNTSPAGH